MNFYRRFPGDYASKTKSLTMLEHGAYTLLLDHLYATEKPLPNNWSSLYRVCSATTKRERNAVKFVTENYFFQDHQGWTNRRADKEMQYADSRRDKAKKAASVRYAPSSATSNATSTAPAMRVPDSRLQTPDKEESNTNTVLVPEDNAFQTFWKAYPKKVNESAAFRAWVKTIGIHNHLEEILTVIMKYEVSGMWDDPTKIPNAENFIKDKRWKDEVPTNGGTKNDQRITRTLEAAKRVMESGSEVGQLIGGTLPRGPVGAGNSNLLRISGKQKP